MVHFMRLSKFGDNASFFRKFDAEFFAHGIFREVAEGGYVAPIRSGRSEEEVRVERGYLRAADFHSFKSSLIDKRSGRMSFRVLEERSTGPACWLFRSAEFAERLDIHRLKSVSLLPLREIETRGYDESVGHAL
jgi:hypothetical protein